MHIVTNCRHPHFLWLNNIPLYNFTTAYLSIDGHFGFFCILAIVNNAAVNIGEQIYFQVRHIDS